MSPFSRAMDRNVHIFDARNRDTTLGGLCLPPDSTAPVTRRSFCQMIGILIVADGPYRIEDASSITVPADDEPLREGNYYIAPEDQSTTVATTQEPVAVRMISLGTGARVGAFRDAVRDRDNGCVMSGRRVRGDNYTLFAAAHIFPLSHERLWIDNNFSRWITILPAIGGAINCPKRTAAGSHPSRVVRYLPSVYKPRRM